MQIREENIIGLTSTLATHAVGLLFVNEINNLTVGGRTRVINSADCTLHVEKLSGRAQVGISARPFVSISLGSSLLNTTVKRAAATGRRSFRFKKCPVLLSFNLTLV